MDEDEQEIVPPEQSVPAPSQVLPPSVTETPASTFTRVSLSIFLYTRYTNLFI